MEMEKEGFYNKFESLPMEAKKQVISYVDFLLVKFDSKKKKLQRTKSVKNKKFIGIWSNRNDLKNSSMWIKKLRKKEWKELEE